MRKENNNNKGVELTLSENAHHLIAKYGACAVGHLVLTSPQSEEEYEEAFLNISVYIAVLEGLALAVSEDENCLEELAQMARDIKVRGKELMKKKK